ncbi:AAA family ATPase [Intestinibacter sp.]
MNTTNNDNKLHSKNIVNCVDNYPMFRMTGSDKIKELYDSLQEKIKENSELENENKLLRQNNKTSSILNEQISEKNYEIETLKDINDILRRRLDRSNSNIRYLKSIENSKQGLSIESNSEGFQEVIDYQIEKDKKQIPKAYIGDEEFVNQFTEYCKKAGFVYSKNLIRAFLASIKSSKLTLLKGYSGVGKTSLAILVAKYLSAEYEIITVDPNWRTKQDIIGFYNYFTNKFIPTELTKILIRANVSPERIFFVVLDEINLAKVEYYFSEFNSKLWVEKQNRKIQLYEDTPSYNDVVGKYIKNNKIQIPDNIFFIGTINEERYAYPISDKIFDRAQVVQFTEIPTYGFNGDFDNLPNLEKNKYVKYSSFIEVAEDDTKIEMSVVDSINRSIKEKFKKVISYRSLREIDDFIKCFNKSGGRNIDALDIQLVSKLEPKFSEINSQNQVEKLKLLRKEINELFKSKLKCNDADLDCLEIIKNIDFVIEKF